MSIHREIPSVRNLAIFVGSPSGGEGLIFPQDDDPV
jgi:hypothetical protein